MTEPTKPSVIVRIRNMGRREKTMAAVLAGMVVLAILFLLLSGGGGAIEGVNTGPVVRTSPTPTLTPSGPPETGQVFEGKDPFQPLVVSAPGGSTGGTTGSPGPSPIPTGSITGVNGGGNTNPAVTVTLIDIRKQNGVLKATVDVNGKDYTAGVGETFAQNFRVISLTTSCGTFVFGDERFSLCKGQEINK